MAEHGAWLAQSQDADTADDEDAALRHDDAVAAMHTLEHDIALTADRVCNEMEQVIRQAIIMPYATTERVAAFIEARADNFHVGFFSTSKRVLRERERRLHELTADLEQRVDAGIAAHLQQIIRALQRDDGVLLGEHSPLSSLGRGFGGAEFIIDQIPHGAPPTRDFGYAFARRLEESIRDAYRSRVALIRPQLLAALNQMAGDARASLQATIERTQAAWETRQRAQRVATELREQLIQLEAEAAYVDVEHPAGLQRALFPIARPEAHPATNTQPDVPAASVSRSPDVALTRDAPPQVKEADEALFTSAAVLAQLREAADLCDTPTLERHRMALLDRARRISDRRYTIAVFGAFSAGKSSLINSLVETSLLPVSPNPTTAAINRVLPPAPEHPDKSVEITVKSREQIAREVMRALHRLGLPPTTIDELPTALARLDRSGLPEEQRPLASYLTGVAAGYPLMADHLGQTLGIGLDKLGDFVATEERAAFAERVDVYAASALADAGIILVDTPGADSLHAR
ncbi:MAG: dynamin family protein, partial [Firmicutes bacterium]|nr:dynamin family protein [Bacillota bacterium]